MSREIPARFTKFLIEHGANARTTGIAVGLIFPWYVKEHYVLPRNNINEFINTNSELITENDFPILDLGCGRRNHEKELTKNLNTLGGRLYIAVDHFLGNDEMYKKSGPNVLGNVGDIPLADSSVGCVVCTEVLEHVPDDTIVLQEIYRVLRNNGKLILSVPGKHIPRHDKLPYQVDYRRHTIEGMKEKLNSLGFDNIKIEDKLLDGMQINIFINAEKR